MKCAFITSTGRTGTGYFKYLFNDTVKNTYALHEPQPAFRSRAGRLIREGKKFGDVTYFKTPRLYRHAMQSQEVYIECNYHLASAIDVVRDAFPKAPIIHLVRDGRSIVTSWLNRYRYITNDHITPEQVRDADAMSKWDKWNPLQKLAWHWCVINRNAQKHNPDLFLKFEEVFTQENTRLFEILELIGGLEYDKNEVLDTLKIKRNATKQEFFPKYKDWPELWREQFWEIAGDTMEHFDYKE